MKKIKEKQNSIETKYNMIVSNNNKSQEDTLKEIEQLFFKDKTNINVLITYLTLKLKKNEDEFLSLFKKYSCFLPEETILNSSFKKYQNIHKTSMELFISFYESIKNCIISKIDKRIEFYYNILTNPSLNKISSNNYVSYEQPELYIYVMYNHVILNIIDKINSFKYDVKKDGINEFIKEKEEAIKKWFIFKKIQQDKINTNENELKIYNDLIKENNNENIDSEKIINGLQEDLCVLHHISSSQFINYFKNFSCFLRIIETNFRKRFSKLDKSKNKKDFELFTYFSVFIAHFDFSKLNNFYINMWLYSLKEDFDINENTKILKNNSYNNLYEYNIINNELILKVYDIGEKMFNLYKVKNISNYIIKNIIDYLSIYYADLKSEVENQIKNESYLDINTNETFEIIINKYEIEKYLNINAYENEIYIKKIWNYWKSFLIKVFTSKVIKDTFKKLNNEVINNFEFYDFLIEQELNIIFDNIKLYQFPIERVLGLTINPIFQIYQYYEGFNSKYGENKTKLLSLNFNLETNICEIIGHINMGIQNYISENELKLRAVSNSQNLKNRNQEFGEYIECMLYGKVITELTYKQMLFLLDENSYNCSCDEFKKNFLECNEKYQPSGILKNFLSLLDIEIEIEENLLTTYTIGKGILKTNNSIFRKPLQHEYDSFYYSPEKSYNHLESLKKIFKRIKKENCK